MKRIKKPIVWILVCAIVLGVGSAFALGGFPSELNPFRDDYYIEDTNQDKPFFEAILPEIAKNVKENNKNSISPYYDRLPLANNPENFQGLAKPLPQRRFTDLQVTPCVIRIREWDCLFISAFSISLLIPMRM